MGEKEAWAGEIFYRGEETGARDRESVQRTWRQIVRFLSAHLKVVMNILRDGCVQEFVCLDEQTSVQFIP